MPQWIDSPPTPQDAMPYRLCRVPPTGTLTGIVTCTDLVGCNTHYLRSRTIPCEGPDLCEACAEGYAYRWHCYLSLLLRPGWEHVILELTAAASDPLRNYCQHHGNARGALIRANRPSARPNGRITMLVTPADLTAITLPPPPNIQRILCHIWGIKYEPPNPGYGSRPPVRDATPQPDDGDGRYRLHQTPK